MDVSYREGVKETRAQKRQFQSIQQPSLGPSSSDPSLSTPDHQPLSFSKRARLDTEPAAPSALVEKTAEVASQGVVFDVTKLPVELVIELVIANLQVTKEDVLLQAVRVRPFIYFLLFSLPYPDLVFLFLFLFRTSELN